MSDPSFWTELSEDTKTAAVIYRNVEAARFKEGKVEERLRTHAESDPSMRLDLQAAFGELDLEIRGRFDAMIPKNKKDADKGPKNFDYFHTIAVMRECFLTRVMENIEAGNGPNFEASVLFTRRRLGLTGDVEDFYKEAGILPLERDVEPGP